MNQILYLSGGCFWGMEKYFSCIPGVIETEVGYANGKEAMKSNRGAEAEAAGAAEAVKITYDPQALTMEHLLEMYYAVIDPTKEDGQGPDIGVQYRSCIFYEDKSSEDAILASLSELQGHYDAPLAIEHGPIRYFVPAREYQQNYLEKNPGGHCRLNQSHFDYAKRSGRTEE
jgi:methionine-S-sulfoxide reductase